VRAADASTSTCWIVRAGHDRLRAPCQEIPGVLRQVRSSVSCLEHVRWDGGRGRKRRSREDGNGDRLQRCALCRAPRLLVPAVLTVGWDASGSRRGSLVHDPKGACRRGPPHWVIRCRIKTVSLRSAPNTVFYMNRRIPAENQYRECLTQRIPWAYSGPGHRIPSRFERSLMGFTDSLARESGLGSKSGFPGGLPVTVLPLHRSISLMVLCICTCGTWHHGRGMKRKSQNICIR
jgi:hypothetical protein